MNEHDKTMLTAFAALLKAEDYERNTIVENKKIRAGLDQIEREAAAETEAAWLLVEQLMAKTGEYEVTVPGDINDFKIHYTTPRESMRVIDDEAVPDEFCDVKLVRKPRLSELKEVFSEMRDNGITWPNWGKLEMGPKKLTWKAVKKRGGE